jgi:hypothetical protein
METLFNLIAKSTHSLAFSGKKNGTVFGKSFIVRQRRTKNRFEVSKEECFHIFHSYKWAFYVQHKQSRSISFKNIKDIKGIEGVQA